MQQRRSPPKHRHDGTSPLPLGMDWSPPPRKWNGKDTVWPHDPRTGWSYCVIIPTWVVLPRSRDSDPVVFYRVQVGVQSPEGVTTSRTVLRRFNDFLKLSADLKKAFPKKTMPLTPPKGLLRLRSRAQLDERRRSLEEWMTKLLSDIELSRNVAVASFLELEAAARSSFHDTMAESSGANSVSHNTTSSSNLHYNRPLSAGSSSITPEYGSDTAYETSEVGTPRQGNDYNSEIGLEDLTLDEDLVSPIDKLVKYGMTNIDEGLFMGQTILEQLEGIPKNKVNSRHLNSVTRKDEEKGSSSKTSNFSGNGMESFYASEHGNMVGHVRKISDESAGSDMSSLRGSELSNAGHFNLSANGSPDLHGVAETSLSNRIGGNTELEFSGNGQVVLPMNQQHKLNRIVVSMQQRLVTTKTDMEDLIARLNQEIAAKDYLATKVKDLEVELNTSKQKSKENLQQAIQVERERFTQMKWEMEELRRKSLEMELKMKSDQDLAGKSHTESNEAPSNEEDALQKELDSTKEELNSLLKQYRDLEVKSKADIKVLVKEVKSLRGSQTELKQQLSRSMKEKIEAEELLQKERKLSEQAKIARRSLLEECRILHSQLQECIINLPSEENGNKFSANSSSVAEALELLNTSDDQISILLEKAQTFVHDHETSTTEAEKMNASTEGVDTTDEELRKMLGNILINNARLTKQVNSIVRHAIKLDAKEEKESCAPENTDCIEFQEDE